MVIRPSCCGFGYSHQTLQCGSPSINKSVFRGPPHTKILSLRVTSGRSGSPAISSTGAIRQMLVSAPEIAGSRPPPLHAAAISAVHVMGSRAGIRATVPNASSRCCLRMPQQGRRLIRGVGMRHGALQIRIPDRLRRQPACRSARLTRLRPARQLPVGADEMASVAVWDTLQIVLVLGLGLPERAGGGHFSHHLARPEA